MSGLLKIAGREFSRNHNLIVGEVAQSHDGSLGMAHSFIDAIAAAGADAVKFQTHIAEAESAPGEPWRVKFSTQDATRFDYWKRTSFAEDQWKELRQHAHEKGLLFLSSPFSVEAVELLKPAGPDAWKIPSGEINNFKLLEKILEARLPILLSTGMSPLREIDAAVEKIKAKPSEFAVLQCTSIYPCPPEKAGLNLIPFFHERYHCPVGLSDHSGKIYAGLAAAALGSSVLEVHAAFSRKMFGPDVASSLTMEELAELVQGVRFIETMNRCPVDKDALAQELKSMRDLFTKSIVARIDLAPGTVLREEHLALKKPGTGIPAAKLSQLIGARLLRSIKADEMIREGDLESEKR